MYYIGRNKIEKNNRKELYNKEKKYQFVKTWNEIEIFNMRFNLFIF